MRWPKQEGVDERTRQALDLTIMANVGTEREMYDAHVVKRNSRT